MLYLLVSLNVLVFVAMIWAFVSKYRSTRDPGLLWLGAALLIWPLIAAALAYGEHVFSDRLVSGEPVGIFPFSLVERGWISLGTLQTTLGYMERLVASSLVLIGILKLYKGAGRLAAGARAELLKRPSGEATTH